MAVEFKLPKIAEGVESGDVLEILVSVGDTLELEQEVVELETDKATVFVPSDVEGVITAINCEIGDTIAVGQAILSVEPAAAAAPAPVESAPVAPAPPVPEKPAEVVQEPVAPVAPVEPVAPVPSVAPVVSKPESTPVETASGKKVMVAAGPAIRRFAREVGVDLQTIQGSGEHGRIVREDVLKVVREGSRQGGSSAKPSAGTQSDGYGPIHVEKMPKIRQTIAKKMHESWTTCPRVTNFDDADVTALEEIRQNSKQEYAAGGIKLTSMPFLVKAVAMALKAHPVINASMNNPHIAYDFNLHVPDPETYRRMLLDLDNLDFDIETRQVYEYYFMRHIYNTEDIFFEDYKKSIEEIGGYDAQFTYLVYEKWLADWSPIRHEQIVNALHGFVASGQFRLDYSFYGKEFSVASMGDK